MTKISRREFLKIAGMATAATRLSSFTPPLFNINRLQATSTLRMLAHSSPMTESFRRAGEAFAEQTGISLEITEVPFNELQPKMMTELLAQTGAYDVLPITNAMMYPASQYLEDITSLFSDELIADLSPASMENARDLNGTFRGMPTTNSLPANFYRTDLLERTGLSAPTTWDEYVEVCKALTIEASGDTPKIWGSLIEASSRAVQPAFKLVGWFYSAGGNLQDADGRPTLNAAPNVEALQFIVDLIHKHMVAPPESAEMIYEDVHNLFIQGRGGTAINWQYMVGLANSSDQSNVQGKFAVAPNPAGKEPGVVVDHWMMVVPSDSANKEAALQFVDFVISSERQADLLKSEGLVARLSAMDPSKDEVKEANPFIEAWLEELKWAKPLPKWQQINDVMLRLSVAMNNAVTQTLTPQEALDEAQTEVVDLLGV
jgi:multiple sugar transport system substrate-binding protein